MTRRNARNRRCLQVEFLEGRNALSHFGAHALAAHVLTHKVAGQHHEVQTLERNDPLPNDSSTDSSTDSSKDSSTDPSSKHS